MSRDLGLAPAHGFLLVTYARTFESLEWKHRDSGRQKLGRRPLRSHSGREDGPSRLACHDLANRRSPGSKAAKEGVGPYVEMRQHITLHHHPTSLGNVHPWPYSS